MCHEVVPVREHQVRRQLATTEHSLDLQRRDMITKHQFALHLIRDSTVIPNQLPQSEHPQETATSRPGTNTAPERASTCQAISRPDNHPHPCSPHMHASPHNHSIRTVAPFYSSAVCMRTCTRALLRVCVVVLLKFTELANPVEMSHLCCNTHMYTGAATRLPATNTTAS